MTSISSNSNFRFPNLNQFSDLNQNSINQIAATIRMPPRRRVRRTAQLATNCRLTIESGVCRVAEPWNARDEVLNTYRSLGLPPPADFTTTGRFRTPATGRPNNLPRTQTDATRRSSAGSTSRNDCARRRSEILKQGHDRFSVAANQRFLLARRVARCGRSRGRRPRALPYHCSGTRTRPMEKGARGTEVLAQTNVMFQRAE